MIPLSDASRRPVHFPILTICIILTNLFVFALELTGGDAFVLKWAGIADHLSTKASPPVSSSAKTNKFVRMMQIVRMGKCTGRRDASLNGIIAPTLFYSVSQDTHQL